ncbi:MAG: hypothetical protein K6G34_08695, partial [Lachnospiraceae bacterium]|nr:hypothetical protein [Lachnospiraceae bacterium]
MKAVIVDLEGQRAAALCEDGSVREVANHDYNLGQEIEISEVSQEKSGNEKRQKRAVIRKWYRRVAAAAAVVLMLAGIGGVSVYAMPYGEVNLEGDTSVVYTINRFDYVIGAKASDETGEQLLEEVGKENLINHKIEKAVEVTLDHIQEDEGSGADVEYHVRTDIGSTESGTNEAHAQELQEKLEKVLAQKAPVKPEGSEGEQVNPLDGAPEESPEPADPEPATGESEDVQQ